MPVRFVGFELLAAAEILIVALCWAAFGGALVYRFFKFSSQPSKQDPSSLVGFWLQLLGIGLVWFVHRPYFTGVISINRTVEIGLAVLGILTAMLSAWMGVAAARVLGRQWSLTARVLNDHHLVTEGPYRLTRHPLYTALLGMILATGLAVSYWFILLAAVVVYGSGTRIRMRSEERLLRAEFGAAYDDFARRVPALIPRLF